MAKKYVYDRIMTTYVTAGIRERKDASEMLEYVMLWFDKGKVSEEKFEELSERLAEYEELLEAEEAAKAAEDVADDDAADGELSEASVDEVESK